MGLSCFDVKALSDTALHHLVYETKKKSLFAFLEEFWTSSVLSDDLPDLF